MGAGCLSCIVADLSVGRSNGRWMNKVVYNSLSIIALLARADCSSSERLDISLLASPRASVVCLRHSYLASSGFIAVHRTALASDAQHQKARYHITANAPTAQTLFVSNGSLCDSRSVCTAGGISARVCDRGADVLNGE